MLVVPRLLRLLRHYASWTLFFGLVSFTTSYGSLPIWARVVWALVMSANMLLNIVCCEGAIEAGGQWIP